MGGGAGRCESRKGKDQVAWSKQSFAQNGWHRAAINVGKANFIMGTFVVFVVRPHTWPTLAPVQLGWLGSQHTVNCQRLSIYLFLLVTLARILI